MAHHLASQEQEECIGGRADLEDVLAVGKGVTHLERLRKHRELLRLQLSQYGHRCEVALEAVLLIRIVLHHQKTEGAPLQHK